MSDPAGDPFADAVAAAVRTARAQQQEFDEAAHVHGPACNPVWQATLVCQGEPVLIVMVVQDPDSPSGHSARIEGRMDPESVPRTLRAIADLHEAQHRAGLS